MLVPHRSRRLLLGLLVTGALLIGACSNSDGDGGSSASDGGDGGGGGDRTAGSVEGVPGVSDESIDFAVLSTGPANPLGTCYLECYQHGIEAYFAYRNSEGGVHDRELRVTRVADDELGKNQVKALEIIEADDTFGVFGEPLAPTGFAEFAKARVPLWTTFVHGQVVAGQESSFATGGVSCISCPSKTAVYLADELGATNIATLGYGTSQASKDCVAGQIASVETYGADRDLEIVYSRNDLAFGLPNGTGPEVTAMKDADVELVLTCLDGNGAMTLAQEMKRQGIDDVPMVLPGDGYGYQPFLDQAGDVFEGDVMSLAYLPLEADTEGTGAEEFLTWIEETGHADTDLGEAMYGWLDADHAYQGILAAGPDFDRERVIEAMNGIEDDTADGLIPPVDWGRQHQAPTADDPVTDGPDPQCSVFLRISDGAYELMGDPAKPFNCWKPGGEYTDPEPTTFTG